MPRRVLIGVALVLVLVGCGSGSTTTGATSRSTSTLADAAPTSPPTTVQPVNVVATAIVPVVAVQAGPADGEPIHTMENPAPPYGTPLVFLVREQQTDWLEVLVPVRPNGTTGWVRSTDVELATHDYRMVVELGAHRLTVHQGDNVIAEEPIGIGTDTAPTPPGQYYTRELLQPENPDGVYGPYAYGLSGYSEVIFDFTQDGVRGDGRLAIHGTSEPESIGKSEGNGCIRISNEAITRLAETLPIGVPVEIRE